MTPTTLCPVSAIDSGRAGVLVIKARNVAVPLLAVEAASRNRASACQYVVAQVKEIAEVPQQHCPVARMAVARVCPSGANATEASHPVVWPVSGSPRRRGCGPVGQVPQQHRRHRSRRLARVRPSGANATEVTPPVWPVSGSPRRRGLARSARSQSSTVPSPRVGGGQGLPVRGERHRAPPESVWPVSGSPRRRGWARSARSHSSTVPSSLALARVRPSGANATEVTPSRSGRSAARRGGAAWPDRPGPTAAPFPSSVARRRWPGSARPGRTPPRSATSAWPVSGLAEAARPGPVGQIPQQHCPVRVGAAGGQRVSARPGRTPPRAHRRVGSAACRAGAAWPGRSGPRAAPILLRRRWRWPGSARPGRTPPRSTRRRGRSAAQPRRRGVARSARSHSSTVPSSPPVARVCPSGANATESRSWRGRSAARRGGAAWPVSQVPQQHCPVKPAVARVRPSGANATEITPRCGRSAARRGGAAWPGRPGPTAAPCLSSVAGGGKGVPVRGERHRVHPAGWPVSGSPRRRGVARSVRSHSSTVLVAAAGGQGLPVRGERHRGHPVGVAGQRLTEAARLGPVGQIPQQHRLVDRRRWPGSARPGRTPPSSPRRCGRSAAHRGGAARPGRPDPTAAPSRSSSSPAVAKGLPVRGERHRGHPPEWPVSGWAEAARRCPVGQIPQQHRPIVAGAVARVRPS